MELLEAHRLRLAALQSASPLLLSFVILKQTSVTPGLSYAGEAREHETYNFRALRLEGYTLSKATQGYLLGL